RVLRRAEASSAPYASVGSAGARTGRSRAFQLARLDPRITATGPYAVRPKRSLVMPSAAQPKTFTLGDRIVNRLGYGAMQLAGSGAFGPPEDRDAALAVLREAVARGVNHIDTSDYYGPHITNELIREALHPYPDDLVIVTKIGARRGPDASWMPAFSP